MKMKISFLPLFCVALLVSACSSDNIEPNTPARTNEKTGISFSMTETDYEDTKIDPTRADGNLAEPKLMDLGNDFEACVMQNTIKSTTPKKIATRAITGPKHYSIRAYKDGVLKGSMKGKFNGSTFTPDAGASKQMSLEPGNYNFICYNDKFHEVGDNVELSQDDAKEAYFCQKEVTIQNQAQQFVPFEMKHACTRLAITLEIYGKPGPNAVAEIKPVGTNVPTKVTYVGATNSFTQSHDGTARGGTLTYSTLKEPDKYGNPGYVTSDDFVYFLPGTDCTDLQMNFTSGTMFGRSLANAGSIRLLTIGSTFQMNKSYDLSVLFWPRVDYLFSDGTTGSVAANPTKERIGLVIQKKTSTSRGLAMALDPISGNKYGSYSYGYNPNNGINMTHYNTVTTAMTDMNGEHWTYDASGTVGGIIKANDQNNFPGVYAAAHYNPGYTITGANVGRWFLPSLGQVIAALNMMANAADYPIDWSGYTDWTHSRTGVTGKFKYICQTPLGRIFPLRGTNRKSIGTIFGGYYGSIITNTNVEAADVSGYFCNIVYVGLFSTGDNGTKDIVLGNNLFDIGGEIRPFIHF